MLYLAATIIAKARRMEARGGPIAARGSPFILGLSMGLTNPFQIGWWIAIGAGMVSEFGASIAGGFFVGILCWTLVFSALVSRGLSKYERLTPLIAYASAAIMAGFGLWFLGLGLTAFL